MAKRALVLGGGGSVGIAWETGLAAGLADEGIDLRLADKIVGTSAGSFVGAELASGRTPAELRTRLTESASARGRSIPGSASTLPVPDLTKLMEFMMRVPKDEAEALALRAEIGAFALERADRARGNLYWLLRIGRRHTLAREVFVHGGRRGRWSLRRIRSEHRHVARTGRRIELRGTRSFPADHDQRPTLHRRRHALGDELRSGRRL